MVDFRNLPLYLFSKVVLNADVEDEGETLINYHHNISEGPMWAVRLLPWSQNQENFINKTKLEPSKYEEELPFLCHLLLSIHHTIIDGYSTHQLIKMMLDLFQEVLEGKVLVDDGRQESEFLDSKFEDELVSEIEHDFKVGRRSLESRSKSYRGVMAECILPEGYELPVNEKLRIATISGNLDRHTTQLFSQRCKREGITFHSGFSAACDAAYVQLLKDGNVLRDSYKITTNHCINHRRYFKDDGKKQFGNGIGVIDTVIDTPNDVLKRFWSYAKVLHLTIKDQQNLKTSLEQGIIEKLTGETVFYCFNDDTVDFDVLPAMMTYKTSNMMDVTQTFCEPVRDKIRLEWYERRSSPKLIPMLWKSALQTLKGQLMHSLQYNSKFLHREVAQQLLDSVFDIISKVSKHP